MQCSFSLGTLPGFPGTIALKLEGLKLKILQVKVADEDEIEHYYWSA